MCFKPDGILDRLFQAEPAFTRLAFTTLFYRSPIGILLRDEGKLRDRVCPNTEAGYRQLPDWLLKQKALCVHACMEATGTYGEALSAYLHQAGHLISVVNPAIIKAFASTEMLRTKTDKRDASLIARYCQKHRPAAWTPPPPEISELQALVRRLESLLDMLHRNATAWLQASLQHR